MKKVLNKGQHILFLVLFGYIYINVLFFIRFFIDKFLKEHPLFISPTVVAVFLYILAVILLLVLLKGFTFVKKNQSKLSQKRLNIYFIAALLFVLIGQIILIASINNVPVTDSAVIEASARNYGMSGDMKTIYHGLEERRINYFATYPNNWGVLLLLSFVYRGFYLVFGVMPKIIPTIITTLAIQISLIFTYLSAKLIFKDKVRPLFCLAMCLLTPMFYLYCTSFYTDILSMPFTIIGLYLFLRAIGSKKFHRFLLWITAAGVVIGLGYTMKGSVVVCIVAFAIYAFLKLGWRHCLSTVLIMVACLGIINTALEKTALALEVTDKQTLQEERVPVHHWVMMSLKGKGGFNNEDFLYTKSFKGEEAKKEANIKEIKKRIKDYGISGLIEHENEKITATWTDGKFFSNHRLSASTGKNGVLKFVRKNLGFEIYSHLIHVVLLTLMLFSFIHGIFEKRITKTGLIRLIVFGIALFLLIWETKSRYLVNFVPIMILVSADGMNYLSGLIKFYKKKLRKRKADKAIAKPIDESV